LPPTLLLLRHLPSSSLSCLSPTLPELLSVVGALTDCLLPWSAAGAATARGQAPEWPGHRRPACCSSHAGPGLQRGRGRLSLYNGCPLPRH
jgi:hypothetical protein